MDSFSVASLTSKCTAISYLTISITSELSHLQTSLRDSTQSELITTFASIIRHLGVTVGRLEASLNGGAIIFQTLQSQLGKSLSSCQGTMGGLNKQIMRIQVDNLPRMQSVYLVAHHDWVAAYGQLFSFYWEILAMNHSEDQDAALDSSDARQVIAQVEEASRMLLKAGDVFADDSTYGAGTQGDLPPPYELSAGPSNPQVQSPKTRTNEGSVFALSSLKNGLKALTSNFSWFKPDPLVSALCSASSHGDIQQIAGLIAQGVNINGRNAEGNTPLKCAIVANRPEAVKVLLASGADVNNWSKIPPLFVAAGMGNVEVAEVLLHNGAEIGHTSVSGQPYFYDAVSGGMANLAGIRFLLEHGANPDASSLTGRKAIVAAVRKGRIDLVELLLDYGANVNAHDYTGSSLLPLALDQPNGIEIAELLLQRGADPNQSSASGESVLAAVNPKKNFAFAKLLLEAGANGRVADIYGQPIIINVIKDQTLKDEDKTEFVRLLLEHGASAEAKDITWSIPALHHAMDKAPATVLSLLLKHGANGTSKMSSDDTPLFHAINNRRLDQVEGLLENDVSAGAPDAKGRTPLMLAAVKHDLEMLKLLRRYIVEIDTRTEELARSLGRTDILEALGLDTPVRTEPVDEDTHMDAPPAYNE